MAFRTQKISQMTPKGSDLEATDLIEVSTIESGSYVTRSITGQELIDAIPAPSVDWGDIGGTLSDQTDLNTALSGKVPTSRTLTINGTTQDLSADRTFTISTGITIGTTAITSGTVGRILFQGTGNVVQQSGNLFWDNTNGTLETTTTADNLFGLRLKSTTGQLRVKPYLNPTYGVLLESKAADGSANLPLTLSGSRLLLLDGNVLINTTTDAGFRLDVNGTARVSGQITTTTANAQFGTIGAATGEFRIDGVNGAGYAFSVYSSNTLRFGVVGFGGVLMPSGFTIVSGSTDLTTTRLRIGTGNTTAAINIQAQTGNTDIVSFKASNGGDQFTIKNTSGNTLIGTSTDAGFRLDVNGTARVKATSTTGEIFTTQTSTGLEALVVYADRSSYIYGSNVGGYTTNIRIGGQANMANINFFGNNNIYVGQGGSTENIPSALIAMGSTNKGFLPPRMTTTQRNAIASPAAGLVVYDNTDNKHYGYNGTTWNAFY